MSQKKRGRPPKPTNQLSSAQRQVHVAQMDFEKLEQCYRHASGDASKRLWDGTGKLLSAAVSEILRLFVVMAQDGGGKKSKITENNTRQVTETHQTDATGPAHAHAIEAASSD